ncbi:MAG: hypothetical protein Q9227_001582 [Pyrenula ochraceoflavens]
MTSFDASQSVSSTPAPTPPPPRSASQQLYGMSGPGMINGMGSQGSFGGYGSMNGYPQAVPFQQGYKPQIYTAVYSNVTVFEMDVNGVAVMRRAPDSWLNATQILKVAGVEKGKRTKILEKEILTGRHEKVQGGYGKYQGTWIDFPRGVEFCRQYGVEELLRPLLEYDISRDSAGGMPGNAETPTKEQAMAAQRKRLYNGMDRPSTQASNGTFFKNLSSTAANAVSAMNKARFDSPARVDGARSVNGRRPSMNQFPGSQESMVPASQQSMQSLASEGSFNGNAANNNSLRYSANFADFPSHNETQEPPRKRMRSSHADSFMNSAEPGLEQSGYLGSPTEPNDSFFSQGPEQSFSNMTDGMYGLKPLPLYRTPDEEEKKQLLISLFLEPDRTDYSDHPAFLSMSGEELERPIDGTSNTVLHWAAALARIALVKQLLAKGFNIRRTNSGGETALMQACSTSNNMDHSTFPDLLKLLGPSMEVRDGRGRTLLHHIAVSSAMKGRQKVGFNYLASLLEYVVQSGTQPSSQESALNGQGFVQHPNQPVGLARFMEDIVNAQDKSGDTALNLAARTNSKAIVHQLLEVGADPKIVNGGGLAPVDFGVTSTVDHSQPGMHMNSFDASFPTINSSQTSFAEVQNEIMASVQEILSASEADFNKEISEKQEKVEKINAKLREASSGFRLERKSLEELQARVSEKNELQRKIGNLGRSASDLRNQITKANSKVRITEDIHIGEADKGLDLEGSLPAVASMFSDDMDLSGSLSQEQKSLLPMLERAEVLAGRVKAYQQHNQGLETQSQQLRKMSRELEERYRKMIVSCLQIDPNEIDEKLPALLLALQSEQKERLDMARVRDFLRMVQGSDP